MDTKLKKSKPFGAWLTFFLSISIMASLLLTSMAILAYSGGNTDILRSPFVNYKDSYAFKNRTSFYFNELLDLALYNSEEDNSYVTDRFSNSARREGENLTYWAINKNSGYVIKNVSDELLKPDGNPPALPTAYNYYWYFDGENISIMKNGKKVDYDRLDSGYTGIVPKLNYYHSAEELGNIAVMVAVKDPLVENYYARSAYYMEEQYLPPVGKAVMALIAVSLLLLAYSLFRRREKREFDRRLAALSGKIWLEVKAFISLMALFLSFAVVSASNYGTYYGLLDFLPNAILVALFALIAVWWFYLMLIDLIFNRSKFFTHNSITSLLNWYRKYEQHYSWRKLMLRRAYFLVATETALAFLSIMFLLSGAVPLAFFVAGLGIYLIYKYLKEYGLALNDFGKLIDHIALITNGDVKEKLDMPENSSLYSATQNLNSIQAGMQIAISEQIKSERLKIDLITNVSHDLKTPLTSIISYVDLLNKEENLPEHVSDYIEILAQKSERLENLIQDLFDLAKASSDNISLEVEKLDLARLIKQTLADMEDPINESGLTFKLNIPDNSVYILSDGKKLYRVWENLITNTLKYSLYGSRVFIDLEVDTGNVVATIKNTANYEMNFTADEILERFARGEASRTSEGSGLGLSIAQSFTQACGGEFAVIIDGDLFKAELKFKTHSPI